MEQVILILNFLYYFYKVIATDVFEGVFFIGVVLLFFELGERVIVIIEALGLSYFTVLLFKDF